jgi:isocitrate dehydrogenase (NAD+)
MSRRPACLLLVQVITRVASSRVAEFAFKFAVDNGRSKVSAVHKANIMKRADGLFIQCCREVSEKYPQIEYEELIVDNACMQVSSSMACA